MAGLAQERGRTSLVNRVRIGDWIFTALVSAAAAVVLLIIVGLFYELITRSWPAVTHNGIDFIWATEWNPPREVFNAGTFIVGTVVTSVAALVIATAIGVLVAIYLVEIAPPMVARPVSFMVELLAAIPSVVFGLWGVFVLGVFIRDDFGPRFVDVFGFIPFFDGTPLITGLLSAVLILATMILPTVMAVSRDVIAAVPRSQREGIVALGATRWEMIQLTVLPYARSGVLGAAILGLARAVGETLAVTLVIGNRVGIPHTIFDPAYTMASAIANQFTEVENDMHRASLLEVALLLLIITFLINVAARLLVWRVTGGQRVSVVE
ncbi:MAG: phosphate ABC transporter permease subunit PstC [Dehalococcoidia bacterium]|nr:phosphate ABC transporter permease subunit PstC [Dehalococcoidia bacterium]HRC62894.1 phosphate ABC transporter permease subunit PstC [Dehalococcoidia bacterium]